MIRKALEGAKELLVGGETSVAVLEEYLAGKLGKTGGCRVEYTEVLAAATLQEFPSGIVETGGEGVLIAVAGWFGEVRLIDNIRVSFVNEVPEVDLEQQGGS